MKSITNNLSWKRAKIECKFEKYRYSLLMAGCLFYYAKSDRIGIDLVLFFNDAEVGIRPLGKPDGGRAAACHCAMNRTACRGRINKIMFSIKLISEVWEC